MSNSATAKLRVLVVDDEPLARVGVAELLKRDDDVVLSGECQTGAEAIAAIRETKPEIVFLDVSMPGLSGFDVLHAVGEDAMPVVVFLTAYDEFALDAFAVHAADYVLKPFETERFVAALRYAKQEVRRRALARVGETIQEALRLEPSDRIVIREAGRVIYVDPRDIDWIDGADYYSRIHAGPRAHLIRQTLASLAASLDHARFMRIHRSVLVNLGRVHEIRTGRAGGDVVVVLGDGTRLKVARARRAELETRLRAL